MTLAAFINDAEKRLAPVLHRTGSILYSAADTLAPGDLYIMGLNPGGFGGPTLREHLQAFPGKIDNAYLDEKWCNQAAQFAPGASPLQKRLKWLTSRLGYKLERVCSSNLIFMKTRDANCLTFPADADICWPVHERMLLLVRPKLVLAFGNSRISPFRYLHRRFGGKEEQIPSGHSNWQCRGFTAQIAARPVYVAGLPHLSRYSPIGRDFVIDWLKSKLR